MKTAYILIVVGLAACSGRVEDKESAASESLADTAAMDNEEAATPPAGSTYSNNRFREVTVEKTGEHQYTISGEGQIFEASFGWVVEDGHNELKEGFATTDAGAPEWGAFEFTVEVEKQRENSTLMLILFETSAKDGSRQHELPVKLE